MLKLLSGFLLFAALCAPAHARVDQVTYMKNGVYSGKIGTYALGGTPYLDAKQAARLIGGKIYWYPVSGKLMLQIKGKTAVFFLRTDSVQLNGVNEQFPAPMIVRGGKAFLALDFFVSRLFSDAFGFTLQYNKATGAFSRDTSITSRSGSDSLKTSTLPKFSSGSITTLAVLFSCIRSTPRTTPSPMPSFSSRAATPSKMLSRYRLFSFCTACHSSGASM